MDYWWPSTQIPLRSHWVNPNLSSEWNTWAEAGRANWNNSTAPVNFVIDNSNSSQNRTFIEPRANRDYLGFLEPIRVSGTSLDRFEIVLNTTSITDHAESRGFSIGNVATSVMAHELGHSVGLLDNPNAINSLMNHSRNRNTVRGPQPFDIDSVRMIYG